MYRSHILLGLILTTVAGCGNEPPAPGRYLHVTTTPTNLAVAVRDGTRMHTLGPSPCSRQPAADLCGRDLEIRVEREGETRSYPLRIHPLEATHFRMHWLDPAETPEGMIYVPGGSFPWGTDGGEGDEQPVRWADHPDYFLDRTEVSNRAYAAFVEATGHRAPPFWDGPAPPPEVADLPVTGVSWEDASAYAAWAGKRLPTEGEWERAARGPDGRIYPWGNVFDPARCRSVESGASDPLPADSLPDGAGPYGHLHLAGNVWEWVSDFYRPYPGNPDTDDVYADLFRVSRGGGYLAPREACRSANRHGEDPTYARERSQGFRCAKDVTR